MDNIKKKALIACMNDPSWNPRAFRTIWLLVKMGYEVWALSPKPKFDIPFLHDCMSIHYNSHGRLNHIYGRVFWKLWRMFSIFRYTHGLSEIMYMYAYGALHHINNLNNNNFDLIVVEDVSMLNVILDHVSDDTRIFFDAREYSTREMETIRSFRIWDKPRVTMTLKKAIPRLFDYYTVCKSLADEYEKDFSRRPEVVRSTPFFQNQVIPIGIGDPIRMVHHGVAHPIRGLDRMIDVVQRLEGRYSLDMYLVGDKRYIDDLRKLTVNCSNVRILDPVKFHEIHMTLSRYDIGFSFHFPTGFNTMHTLPNKFFEYIQARLAVLVGPSPEMASLVAQYSCGAVSDDFNIDSMVRLLDSLKPDDIIKMKRASADASKVLCWECESKKLIEIFERRVFRC